MKFKETECIRDKPRSERFRAPVKVVAEVHNMMPRDQFHASENVSSNLDVPKAQIFKLCTPLCRCFLSIPMRRRIVTCKQPTVFELLKFCPHQIRYDGDSW